MSEIAFGRLWSSRSLVFRAVENNTQDKNFLYESMMLDPASWAQGTNRLLRPLNRDEIGKNLEGMAKSLLAIMICLPGTGDTNGEPITIGYLSLDGHAVSRHHRSCTLGISIQAKHQGKGYGTESITWAVDWAFRVAGMHAVRLACFSFNERAVKLYERIGFVREGSNREAYFYDGKWYDRILFSMLENEWKSLQSADFRMPTQD